MIYEKMLGRGLSLGFTTLMRDMIANDKSIQRRIKQSNREAQPVNRNKENERRKRQIERGVLKPF